jgi:hypothetical protein
MIGNGFRVGDSVSWRSQAGGYWKEKVGVVVFVVPAGVPPHHVLRSSDDFHGDFALGGRDHETYLVQIGKSKNLYWPRVSALNPCFPAQPVCRADAVLRME